MAQPFSNEALNSLESSIDAVHNAEQGNNDEYAKLKELIDAIREQMDAEQKELMWQCLSLAILSWLMGYPIPPCVEAFGG